MKYFPVTFILMVASETLLAAVMSGFSHLTNGQEVEENLIISRRRAAVEHDHRTDSPYVGIFNDEDDIETLKHLSPFETKKRMKTKLESMDQNKNGIIEKNELADKLFESYRKLAHEESDSEFENFDLNEDGYITWNEYVSDDYAPKDDFEDDVQKEEKDLFNAADIDKDGKLSILEFRCFYTPEDYPHMQQILIDSVVNRFDINKDGKVSFDEYVGDRKLENDLKWLEDEKTRFEQELDINKNGVLEGEELHIWATPSNMLVAESEAKNLILKSDKNKDELLSYEEILDNYQLFISPESEGYYIFKDEL